MKDREILKNMIEGMDVFRGRKKMAENIEGKDYAYALGVAEYKGEKRNVVFSLMTSGESYFWVRVNENNRKEKEDGYNKCIFEAYNEKKYVSEAILKKTINREIKNYLNLVKVYGSMYDKDGNAVEREAPVWVKNRFKKLVGNMGVAVLNVRNARYYGISGLSGKVKDWYQGSFAYSKEELQKSDYIYDIAKETISFNGNFDKVGKERLEKEYELKRKEKEKQNGKKGRK